MFHGKPDRKRLLTDLVDKRMILKCILKKEGMMMWTRFIWNRTGSSVRSFWTWQ
jgi:hypothetical protein